VQWCARRGIFLDGNSEARHLRHQDARRARLCPDDVRHRVSPEPYVEDVPSDGRCAAIETRSASARGSRSRLAGADAQRHADSMLADELASIIERSLGSTRHPGQHPAASAMLAKMRSCYQVTSRRRSAARP
jgi:hypothetical protein